MPIYDYKCQACGKVLVDCFEKVGGEEHLCVCGKPMRKVIGQSVGIVFRGPGWEHDGYGLRTGEGKKDE